MGFFVSKLKKETAISRICLTMILVFFCIVCPKLLRAEFYQLSSIVRLPEDENVILVEKKTQTLFVYSGNGEELVLKFKAPCSTGEVAGIKQVSGDKKTPEGVYFLIDEYEDKDLTPIYGKKAFPTDYPNFIDKRQGKNGFAIWIHGTNKELKPMDSNGCVALENENIIKLADYVSLDSTPVIMMYETKTDTLKNIGRHEKGIVKVLEQWTTALEGGTYHQYLSFYASTYLPSISWWEDWEKLRRSAKEIDSDSGLRTNRVGIYNHENVFVVLFDSFLTLNSKEFFLGKRKLFLEKQKDGYRIVGDQFQKVPNKQLSFGDPMVAAASGVVVSMLKNKRIIETVNQWLTAWSSKDMEKYSSFYSKEFISDGMGKAAWVKRKKTLAQKYSFINISGTDFKVELGGETCEVSFFQEYESSGYTTRGTKTLKLTDEGGLWKIYQEIWKKN